MTLPAVSVAMPLYNKEREVLRAVASVQEQTVTTWELLVINDGSTDRGPDIVRSLRDPRIRVFDQSNGGVSAARNRGIREAKSDLVAFLDADDVWNPEFLAIILDLRTRFPQCAVFGTRYLIRHPNGSSFPARIRGLPDNMIDGEIPDYFLVAAQSAPPLWTSAVAVTRQALEAVGGFPVGISTGEDLLTWARLALHYHIAYTQKICAVFNTSDIVRLPDEPDTVGMALSHLYEANPMKPGLRQYVARWHRMQLVMFLHTGEKARARTALRKIAGCTGWNLDYLKCIVAVYGPRWLYRLWVVSRGFLGRIRVCR